jgi:hypothetical protein
MRISPTPPPPPPRVHDLSLLSSPHPPSVAAGKFDPGFRSPAVMLPTKRRACPAAASSLPDGGLSGQASILFFPGLSHRRPLLCACRSTLSPRASASGQSHPARSPSPAHTQPSLANPFFAVRPLPLLSIL